MRLLHGASVLDNCRVNWAIKDTFRRIESKRRVSSDLILRSGSRRKYFRSIFNWKSKWIFFTRLCEQTQREKISLILFLFLCGFAAGFVRWENKWHSDICPWNTEFVHTDFVSQRNELCILQINLQVSPSQCAKYTDIVVICRAKFNFHGLTVCTHLACNRTVCVCKLQ